MLVLDILGDLSQEVLRIVARPTAEYCIEMNDAFACLEGLCPVRYRCSFEHLTTWLVPLVI
jgi:hypothetical protein